MNKYELKEIVKLNDLINSNLRQLEDLKACRGNLQGMRLGDKVQSSNRSNRIEQSIEKIMLLEDLINIEIDELVSKKIEAKKEFELLSTKNRTLMEMRYLECLTWDKIAEHIDCSKQHVFKLHGEALKELRLCTK